MSLYQSLEISLLTNEYFTTLNKDKYYQQ